MYFKDIADSYSLGIDTEYKIIVHFLMFLFLFKICHLLLFDPTF